MQHLLIVPISNLITRMPSKSRKKIKGQARKARAQAATATIDTSARLVISDGSGNVTENHFSSQCNHVTQYQVFDICEEFIREYFQTYMRNLPEHIHTVLSTRVALDAAFNKSPIVANNKMYMSMIKKTFISNGIEYVFGSDGTNNYTKMTHCCAAALMMIDSYDPLSPIPRGNFDQRDANKWLTFLDIMNGCQHSLIKFYVKQIPCKCLDELYARVRSKQPKIGMCKRCQQMKARSSLYVCTGCERAQYCSKACQLADVPDHKDSCKAWRSGNFSLMP